MRICKKCFALFDDGKRCKECHRRYHQKYKIINKESIKKKNAEYYSNNKEKIKNSTSAWSKANREKTRIYVSRWSYKNPKYRTLYRNNNLEKIKLKEAEKRIKYKSSIKAASKKYAQNHAELFRIKSHNRRVLIKNSGGKLSRNIIKKLLILQKGKCACCGKLLKNHFHLDHINPLAMGGVNKDWNIQLLSPTCNQKKGSLHPIDYMQSRGFLL